MKHIECGVSCILRNYWAMRLGMRRSQTFKTEIGEELAALINKKGAITVDAGDLSDNGKIPRPSSPGLAARDRMLSELENALPHAQAFFKRIETCLFELPAGRELGVDADLVFDSDIGYCFPSKRQVMRYTKREGAARYINASKANSDKFINELISEVNSNIYKKTEQYHPHIEFITGKVGSGKSTFIDFVKRGYGGKFVDNKILFVLIPHDQLAPTGVYGTSASKAEVQARQTKITMALYRGIAASLNKNEMLVASLGGRHELQKGFGEYCVRHKATFDPADVWSVTDIHLSLGNETIRSLPLLARFLSSVGVKFLVAIDGLDTISFGKIVNDRYDQFFDDLAGCIYGRRAPQFTIPNTTYIITLRSCTYERFVQGHREHDGQTKVRPLVPCEFSDLLGRGVKYFNSGYAADVKFWEGHDQKVASFWSGLLEKFIISLDIPVDSDVSSHFEYNHRDVMRAMKQMAIYVVSTIYSKKGGGSASIFDILPEVDSVDSHDIFEAYLLNNRMGYFNSIDAGAVIRESVNGGSVDNVFNYSLNNRGEGGVDNFLMIKVRILQCLDYHAGYSDIGVVAKFLKAFGYVCSQPELTHLLNVLQAAKFVKIIHRTDQFEWNISEFGKLVLGKLIKNTRYVENVLLDSLFPRILVTHFGGASKYGEKITKSTWISQSISNIYLLVQVINQIEAIEGENFQKNRGYKFYPNLKWCIADGVSDGLIDLIRKIESHDVSILRGAAKTISENIKSLS